MAFFQTPAKLHFGTGTTRSLAQSTKLIGTISTPSGVAMTRNSHLKSRRATPGGPAWGRACPGARGGLCGLACAGVWRDEAQVDAAVVGGERGQLEVGAAVGADAVAVDADQ